MEIKKLKVRLIFTEEVLGMQPGDKEMLKNYIASKAPNALSMEEEIAVHGVESVLEKEITVFPRMDDESRTPFIWNYQLKGFFKDSCGMLRKVEGSLSSKIKAYKKEIDGNIFIVERKIPFHFDGKMGFCERSLRAQTPQGERIAIAKSETIPAGAYVEFTIEYYNDSQLPVIKEWLDYGRRRGTHQWRNSGKGTFVWEEIVDNTEDKHSNTESNHANVAENNSPESINDIKDIKSSSSIENNTNTSNNNETITEVKPEKKKRGRPRKIIA